MDGLWRGWNRVRAYFRKGALDADLEREMAAHLEMAVDENVARGMTREEARRQALVRFGGVEQAREGQRAARGLPFLDVLRQDVRYTLRTLGRDVGFTTVAVLILGLGIGANVAVFSVVNTILLRPLPFPESQQLVWIAPPPEKCGLSCATYSIDAYDEFRAESRSYQDVTGYDAFTSPDNLRLTVGDGTPQPATGIRVLGNFLQMLGVQPMLGRLFVPADTLKSAHWVVLLEYGYWKRQFAGDPGIVGREIDLSGQPATVVGVLPESFDFGAVFSPGSRVDLLTPATPPAPTPTPLLSTLRIDAAALGWTVAMATAAALLFGLAPGLQMAAQNLQEALKDSGPGTGAGRKHERVRSALVIAEVGLACVLLVGAGLLLRSFVKVLDVDLGFRPAQAASMRVEYDDSAPTGDASALKRGAIFRQIRERVDALPGVQAAGFADFLPLGRNRAWGTPTPKGKVFPEGTLHGPLVYVISPGYFAAMGMHVRGREFTWDDGPKSQRVVIINASAARVYWPGEDAVGQILQASGGDCRVVGVVDDIHADSVEGDPGWQIYYPITQQDPDDAQLVIRTTVPPTTLAGSVLHTLRELNPNQPAAEFRPLAAVVARANSPRRFFMLLVAIFAGLGLLLASLGIYGVVAYMVTRQTQEIGIRMALGASRGRVLRGVLRRTLVLVGAGLAVGTLASLAVGRGIASLLFGTQPTDGLTYAGMVVMLLVVAVVAGYLPARRASRIDPMVALRTE